MSQFLPVYASISASDGIGYVSKPEFNSVLADFNARISTFETGLNTKIESLVNTYLRGIDMSGAKGYVINNEAEITGTKDAAGVYTNVTAIIGIEIADLKIGDNIYIKDNDSYDYWVSQISPTVSLSVLNQKINVEDYQKNLVTKVSGNAGELLARNATNDGLVFISKQDIFDIMRPINSTFVQYSTDDDPNSLFNGGDIASTWEKVVLSESYIQFDSTKTVGTAISATAKTDNHTLTLAQMPKHTHGTTNGDGLTTSRSYAQIGNLTTGRWAPVDINNPTLEEKGEDKAHSHNLTNVHPKGQTAILWKRTA